MSNYNQNYNLENSNVDLPPDENKKVNRYFAAWVICTVVAFALPVLTALISIFAANLNPLAVISAFYALVDFIGIDSYFIILFIVLVGILQHVLAIVCKIKFPHNQKSNKVFLADMIILAIVVIAIVVWLVSVNMFCNTCLSDAQECG